MDDVEIADLNSGATARIAVDCGFNLYSLRLPAGGRFVDVLDFDPEFRTSGTNPAKQGIPLLFPFPNRIRGGRFQWNGKSYHLATSKQDDDGNAIHGLVVDRPWRVVSQSENRITGQFQLSQDAPERKELWPADFLIEVSYELRGSVLRCDVRIENPDSAPLPWGFGTHPYFRVPLGPGGDAGQCLVQVPARRVWELVDCLPTGESHPVAGRSDLREGQALAGQWFDDVLTGLETTAGRTDAVLMDPSAGLQIVQTAPALFRELVVFIPPHRRSVCLEPYTCITDAVNLAALGMNTGWQTLAPGATIQTWFQIAASAVYA